MKSPLQWPVCLVGDPGDRVSVAGEMERGSQMKGYWQRQNLEDVALRVGEETMMPRFLMCMMEWIVDTAKILRIAK